ncbi:hypothetical protein ACSCB1_32720 [Streptomyces europaeiscabiei]|uniref:Uncharacterized protein n=1 Tax=Streptomyces europaeiscabiei TaxID=146819 RepID=A0ABU4NM05_9ACTN|nr:hypothetical protein [Streptomyces europaeiscabiei]MDX2529055.1 hypothetical protein [Streptomyces europaeiscabiei]MDX2760007.1 hypothetical protein [Streptomyces europaeiscabiei]MDX2767209.1 hypothetical protein [Streptomyces europaeiscabiei]MDX3546639.1 hypothetical protein [Streptomyces europaeiscabiei]MDX3556333.1 hypothetical protein [Streptomyces europaeiscabiei]
MDVAPLVATGRVDDQLVDLGALPCTASATPTGPTVTGGSL